MQVYLLPNQKENLDIPPHDVEAGALIQQYNDNDIILAGGKKTYNNPGYTYLRTLVRQHLHEFSEGDRYTRTVVVDKIMDILAANKPPSRFLRRVENTEANLWYQVDRKEIIKTVRHNFALLKHMRKIEDCAKDSVHAAPSLNSKRAQQEEETIELPEQDEAVETSKSLATPKNSRKRAARLVSPCDKETAPLEKRQRGPLNKDDNVAITDSSLSSAALINQQLDKNQRLLDETLLEFERFDSLLEQLLQKVGNLESQMAPRKKAKC